MNRLHPDADDARFLRRLFYIVVVGALVVALYRALDLLILAFGSMLGAIIIHAIADLYERWLKLPERAAVVAGMATVLAAIGFLIWLFTVQFGEQVNQLVVALPGLLDQLARWASQSPVGERIVIAVEDAYAGSRIAQDVGGLVVGGGQLALNFLLLIIGALFFAATPGRYERGFLLLVPPSKRDAVEDALFDAAARLRLWLVAQVASTTILGTLTAIGLWVSGVPSAAALGLLSGLSEFIPYVGPAAAMLPALGLAATAGTGPLVGALVTFAVVRLVQVNLVTPLIQARVILIPPAITLFAILAVGMVLGLFGLFFSGAILVLCFSLVRSLYLREVLGEPVEKTVPDSVPTRGDAHSKAD